MAGEQTAYLDSGSTGTDVVIAINCIDSTGSHTALTIDTTTTRLHGYSVVPTADLSVGTGIATITFANVQSLAEGQRLVCKINGTANGIAFSEYAIPVIVRADERGTDSVTSLDAAGVRTAVGLASANLDTQLNNINTQVGTIDGIVDDILIDTGTDIPASIAALNDFDPTTDTVANVTTVGSVSNAVTTDTASRDASKADVSALATSAEIAALNNFDPTTDQVIVGTNTDKTDYALSSAANDAIGAAFLAYTLTKGSPGTIERAFWQSLKATQLTDGEVSGTPTASAFDTNLSAVTGAYDHLLLLFTSGSLAGEARPIDTYNSTNGRITLQEPLTAAPSSSDEFIVVPDHTDPISEIYAYFTDGSNEDAFKADVTALATQASVDTIDGIVDAIKVKTDELTFTVPGSVDATATVVGGDATAANQTTIISHLTDIKGGTFDDTTDSLEAIRDRGDIAWATAGTGIYSLTVTVKDVSDNLISGARVNIDGTASTLTSNSSGQVVFNLDAGSYTLVTSPPSGYQTPANVNVTVSSDDSSEIILTATSTTSDAGWLG